MRLAIAFMCVSGLFLVCGRPVFADDKEKAIQAERKKYEGTWVVASLEISGNKSAEEDARKIKVINKLDGTWTVEVNGARIATGKSTIDPMQKPKMIDFTPEEGMEKGMKYLGIYELDGDTRKLCFAEPGKDRPTEFSAKPASGHFYVTFTREKN